MQLRLIVLLLASCTFGERTFTLRPLPDLPPPEPDPFIAKMTELRTTLGRAGISVESRGVVSVLYSADCAASSEDCQRCDLAAEGDELFPRTLEAVTRAFASYPTYVLEAAKIERVALCRKIDYPARRRETRPAGSAYADEHRVLISFEYFTGETYHDESTGFTLEDVVHHELYHLLDYETSRHAFTADAEWELLNPIDFRYGAKHEDPTGFVNTYAKTNFVEDRASVYQYLMTRPEELCRRAAADPALAGKIELVASRLAAAIDIAFLTTRAPCIDIKKASPLRRRYAEEGLRRIKERRPSSEGLFDDLTPRDSWIHLDRR